MGGEVRIERDGPIASLVFDHEKRRNAITVDMWEAIPGAMRTVQDDASVRVVIMRGAGSEAFVSGADISEFQQTRTGSAGREYDAMTERAFAALQGLEKPLIASIHGFCIGGGAAIALTADLRYAADDARFAVPPARGGRGDPTPRSPPQPASASATTRQASERSFAPSVFLKRPTCCSPAVESRPRRPATSVW